MTSFSLPDERRPYFTKQSRMDIPESTLQLIREKNWMDVQLFEYAVELYDLQLKYQRENGLLEEFPEISENATTVPPGPRIPLLL